MIPGASDVSLLRRMCGMSSCKKVLAQLDASNLGYTDDQSSASFFIARHSRIAAFAAASAWICRTKALLSSSPALEEGKVSDIYPKSTFIMASPT